MKAPNADTGLKLGQFQCPHCLTHVTRKRGNLRTFVSLQRAIQSLFEKHVRCCSMRPPSSEERSNG